MPVLLLVTVLSGCAVPQRPGRGAEMHLQEPRTKAWYRLYLPEGYAERSKTGEAPSRKHPLVMTFHGMKPFDNAHSQCREWQQEADRYGFVVCAPELRTPALFVSPLPPLRRYIAWLIVQRVVSALAREPNETTIRHTPHVTNAMESQSFSEASDAVTGSSP